MRDLFPGYFRPTDDEFDEVWKVCTFSFDANVLLGFYRSTSGTQNVFFGVLERLADRIFLPNQAAREYLDNRLEVISARARIYEDVKNESEKLERSLENTIGEHELANKQEILNAAKETSRKISELVKNAAKNDPDLLNLDGLRDRLVQIFEGKVGIAFSNERLRDIQKDADDRFAKRIPPGYMDAKKGDPQKYGDVVIWFQIMEHAKATKKPLIFVTGDTKEDWWLVHRGETIGPRPELGQEMKTHAGVSFYMYTAPQFLSYAQKFLKLNLKAAQKAASELEQIEKQAKEDAAMQRNQLFSRTIADLQKQWLTTNVAANAFTQNYPQLSSANLAMFNSPVSNIRFPEFINTFPQNPTLQWAGVPNVIWQSPTMPWLVTNVSPTHFQAVSAPTAPASVPDYSHLLPIQGRDFNFGMGRWRSLIVNQPGLDAIGRVFYEIKFEHLEIEGRMAPRNLKLWLSDSLLQRDHDDNYKAKIYEAIDDWLRTDQVDGEIECMDVT